MAAWRYEEERNRKQQYCDVEATINWYSLRVAAPSLPPNIFPSFSGGRGRVRLHVVDNRYETWLSFISSKDWDLRLQRLLIN